jgi:hypothetical protein
MQRHSFILYLVVLTLVFLVACTTPTMNDANTPMPIASGDSTITETQATPTVTPLQWWSDPTCHPPCWAGVTPGETTPENAVTVLDRNAFFNSVSVMTDNAGELAGEIEAKFSYLEGNAIQRTGARFFYIPTNQNPVYAIRSNFPSIDLEEAIQYLGSPTHVLAFLQENSESIGNERWEVRVLWLNQGVEIISTGYQPLPELNSKFRLKEWTTFFVPTLDGYERAYKGTVSSNYLRSWQGYDRFEEYQVYLFE